MVNIVRRLNGGEEVWIKELDDAMQAKALVESFKEFWPGVYIVRDSVSGREIDIRKIVEMPYVSAMPKYVH